MFLVQLFSNAPECTNKMFSYNVGAELEGWGCREDSSKGGAQETWHKQMTQQHTRTHSTIVSQEDISAPEIQQPDSNYAATL